MLRKRRGQSDRERHVSKPPALWHRHMTLPQSLTGSTAASDAFFRVIATADEPAWRWSSRAAAIPALESGFSTGDDDHDENAPDAPDAPDAPVISLSRSLVPPCCPSRPRTDPWRP